MIDRRRLLIGAAASPFIVRSRAAAADTLFVLAWPGYADDAMAKRFTALTGVDLVIDTVGSYDEIFSRLREGYGNQYSVIVPHHGLTRALQQQNLIQPIDTAQISNLPQVDPHFALETQTVIGGEKYAVPVLFGTTPCIYNTEKLPEPPMNWSDLDSDDFTGKIGMLDDGLSHFYLAGRSIGSTTVPTLTNAEFGKARELLVGLKSTRVSHFTQYPNDLADQLNKGKAIISTVGWEGLTLFNEAGGKLAVARLAPGDFSFVQTLAIPTSAPMVTQAHRFIDFMLNAGEQAELSNRTMRGIVNQGATATISPPLLALTNYSDLDAVFAQSPILDFPPLSEPSGTGRTYVDWVIAWDAIRLTTSKAAP